MRDEESLLAEHDASVRRIAARLCAQLDVSLERAELEAWGRLGLVEAQRRFDPERGVRFSTFAYYRIRGAMIDGLRRSGYVSRRAHAKLRAAEATDDLAESSAGARSPEGAAARARVIDDTLGKISAAYVISAVGQDPDEPRGADAEQTAETRQLASLMGDALAALPEREQKLIRAVYFDGRTLESVSSELGLSKSWGSRLHARALAQLRESMAT